MDIFEYYTRRKESLNKHYEWLTNYVKTIDTSPTIEQVVLLCDNFANELMILNNEANYRLETALKLQDEKINRLSILINEMHGTHADLEDIKEEQNKLTAFRESLENAAKSKTEQLDDDIKKNEDDLKRGSPWVG